MDASVEALSVFVVLMPGFVTTIILNTLVVRPKHDSLRFLVEALVFSFLIYSVVAISSTGELVSVVSIEDGDTTRYRADPNTKALLIATASSVLLALVLAFALTHDVHMRFLRTIGITRRTSRHTTWLDVFSEQDRYVVVHLDDGKRVRGWPQYYSDTPEEGLLYLHHPAWITKENNVRPLTNVHGLFIVKTGYIKSIAFQENSSPTGSSQKEE